MKTQEQYYVKQMKLLEIFTRKYTTIDYIHTMKFKNFETVEYIVVLNICLREFDEEAECWCLLFFDFILVSGGDWTAGFLNYNKSSENKRNLQTFP